LDPATACQMEPLLNPHAISGALQLPHGHINPLLTTLAYTKAMQRHGGEILHEQVLGLISRRDQHISGVNTAQADYHAHGVIICAGGFSRALLKTSGISIPLYFTHAESIEVSPAATKEIKLSSIVMPAALQRMGMEAIASTPDHDHLWEQENHEFAPPIMDAGVIQFSDQSLRLGQISRVLSSPHAEIDAAASEAQMRHQIDQILPSLANLQGTWYHCLVAYCHDYLPLIGQVADFEGLHIFSGFSNPLVFVPTLAQRFSKYLTGSSDDIIDQLSPSRFREKEVQGGKEGTGR
jgi:glycine/D-amino acid oxidase-like deaminating enzyme